MHDADSGDPARRAHRLRSPAWGVKEQLRRLLTSATVEAARTEKMILGCYVLAADKEETWRLWATIEAWWTAIEVLIATGVTNDRTEAANPGRLSERHQLLTRTPRRHST